MKMEDHFSETLRRAVSSEPPVIDAWSRFERRLTRRRRARLALSLVAGAATVAAAALVVPNLVPDRDVTPIDPSPTPATPATASPSETPTSAPVMPDEIIAISLGDDRMKPGDDEIVAISSATGKVLRVVARGVAADPAPVNISFLDVSRAPNGDVYFTRSGSDENWSCGWSIRMVPAAGGAEVTIARGFGAAVSPDGTRLAYVSPETTGNCTNESLVIRDLATGDERRWEFAKTRPGDPAEGRGPFGLAWSPDSKRLAFHRVTGDPYYQVWFLDPTQGTKLTDAREFTPRSETRRDPVYGGTRFIAAVKDLMPGEGGDFDPSQIVSLDADGKTVEVLADPKKHIESLDADASGEYLVFTTSAGVFRWSDGTLTQIVVGNYGGASW